MFLLSGMVEVVMTVLQIFFMMPLPVHLLLPENLPDLLILIPVAVQ